MHFDQYQASSTVLGWPGTGDCCLMHTMQSGSWSCPLGQQKIGRSSKAKAPSLDAVVLWCILHCTGTADHNNDSIVWSHIGGSGDSHQQLVAHLSTMPHGRVTGQPTAGGGHHATWEGHRTANSSWWPPCHMGGSQDSHQQLVAHLSTIPHGRVTGLPTAAGGHHATWEGHRTANSTWWPPSLASQTHFRKKGKGLVNCVYKPCPTGMQLAGWRNQISNNALLNYLLQSKHAPWKLFSKCFYGCCSSGKDVLALFRCFQDCYYYSNNDVMCHVTKYCNMIGPHCTLRRDKACIRSSPDPSLFCGSGSGLRD